LSDFTGGAVKDNYDCSSFEVVINMGRTSIEKLLLTFKRSSIWI